jgi:uncharacterized protein (DUF1501 family)
MIINQQSITGLSIPVSTEDRVTVIIQLVGGNDGLNTVIPIDQYNKYFNARSNIAIPENTIIKLTDKVGLHPSMSKMRELYDNSRLAIIQNVGMPNPNTSHFRATDIWNSASDSDIIVTSGWEGRLLETLAQVENHPSAVQIGSVSSLLFQGITLPMGITLGSPTDFYDFINGIEETAPNEIIGKELSFIEELVRSTEEYGETIKTAYNSAGPSPISYQNTSISSQLSIVAKLIAGGLKSKVYLVSQEGYDTHSMQSDSHSSLLDQLSNAISSFIKDLEFYQKEDNVICMTFSEFGRRIKSNDSLGTDHGTAAPLFVVGKNVKAGIYGNNPFIPENVTVEDNLNHEFDFRSVYTTILQDWQGITPEKSQEILFTNFEKLNFMATEGTTPPPVDIDIYNMQLHEVFFNEETNEPLVMRVPGGWIYYMNYNPVFIPFNNEFQQP